MSGIDTLVALVFSVFMTWWMTTLYYLQPRNFLKLQEKFIEQETLAKEEAQKRLKLSQNALRKVKE